MASNGHAPDSLRNLKIQSSIGSTSLNHDASSKTSFEISDTHLDAKSEINAANQTSSESASDSKATYQTKTVIMLFLQNLKESMTYFFSRESHESRKDNAADLDSNSSKQASPSSDLPDTLQTLISLAKNTPENIYKSVSLLLANIQVAAPTSGKSISSGTLVGGDSPFSNSTNQTAVNATSSQNSTNQSSEIQRTDKAAYNKSSVKGSSSNSTKSTCSKSSSKISSSNSTNQTVVNTTSSQNSTNQTSDVSVNSENSVIVQSRPSNSTNQASVNATSSQNTTNQTSNGSKSNQSTAKDQTKKYIGLFLQDLKESIIYFFSRASHESSNRKAKYASTTSPKLVNQASTVRQTLQSLILLTRGTPDNKTEGVAFQIQLFMSSSAYQVLRTNLRGIYDPSSNSSLKIEYFKFIEQLSSVFSHVQDLTDNWPISNELHQTISGLISIVKGDFTNLTGLAKEINNVIMDFNSQDFNTTGLVTETLLTLRFVGSLLFEGRNYKTSLLAKQLRQTIHYFLDNLQVEWATLTTGIYDLSVAWDAIVVKDDGSISLDQVDREWVARKLRQTLIKGTSFY